MLTFIVHDETGIVHQGDILHASILGNEEIAVQGAISYADGRITCEKRSAEAAALALMADAGKAGQLILPTCMLPDRERPYILYLELARHRIKFFLVKLEDWLLFELDADHPILTAWGAARDIFTEALVLETTNPVECERLARQALEQAILVTEQLAIMHADILLTKRFMTRQMPPRPLGCQIYQSQYAEPLAKIVAQSFDYISMPIRWREVEPEEGEYDWSKFDRWMEWARLSQFPVVVGPLIDFRSLSVPDWLYVWEHDYDTTHDLLHEHIESIVKRYKDVVSIWNVASSLHINESFTLAYDQLMDLTRMATSLVKSLHPQGRTMLEVTDPFGEYFFANPRSIPPIVYAETVAQSGYKLDLIGINIKAGGHRQGQGMRDLMQMSAMLDKLLYLETPVIITGIGAPSHRPKPESESSGIDPAGHWREPWSPAAQSEFLSKMIGIGLSKPYIESVCIHELFDHPAAELFGAGLITGSGRAKPALQEVAAIHKKLQNGSFRCSTPEERQWSIANVSADMDYIQ